MANVSNVSLVISDSLTESDQKVVTVSGTMSFEASEVGRIYRLEIKLFGEDKTDDKLSFNDSMGDDELSTFFFPLNRFFLVPFKRFTVTTIGSQSFTETRTISNNTLDEDPGSAIVAWADINTPIYMPLADEVYAKVVLSVVVPAPSYALSNTVRTVGV